MKSLRYLLMFLTIGLLAACQDDDTESPIVTATVLEVNMESNIAKNTRQEIEVKIRKPTPCHQVKEINLATEGTTYNYDIILEPGAEVCIQVIQEEDVQVTFEPQVAGQHTLNFFIDGHLYATRKVEVND